MPSDIERICEKAVIEGQKIDLKDCIYGFHEFPHRDGVFIDKPCPYYFFLSGLVKSQRLTHIFEIGTHFGGSIMSMSRGLHTQDVGKSKLVTVDIACKNEEVFKEYPHIKRIQGDVISKKLVKEVIECFDRNIDLIFIDSEHRYVHVKLCIAIYANRLKPKYIILDDIHWNDSMKKLWRELTNEFRDKAFDITEISRREKGAGFGIIVWDSTFRRNWRYKEFGLKFLNMGVNIYKRISPMLPTSLKHTINKIARL